MSVFRKFYSPESNDPGGLTRSQVKTDPSQAAARNLQFRAGESVDQEQMLARFDLLAQKNRGDAVVRRILPFRWIGGVAASIILLSAIAYLYQGENGLDNVDKSSQITENTIDLPTEEITDEVAENSEIVGEEATKNLEKEPAIISEKTPVKREAPSQPKIQVEPSAPVTAFAAKEDEVDGAEEIAQVLRDRNASRPVEQTVKFQPLYNFRYRDQAKMLTVGGVLAMVLL